MSEWDEDIAALDVVFAAITGQTAVWVEQLGIDTPPPPPPPSLNPSTRQLGLVVIGADTLGISPTEFINDIDTNIGKAMIRSHPDRPDGNEDVFKTMSAWRDQRARH